MNPHLNLQLIQKQYQKKEKDFYLGQLKHLESLNPTDVPVLQKDLVYIQNVIIMVLTSEQNMEKY